MEWPWLLLYPLFYLAALLAIVVVVFYAERKLAAFIQDRLGPMEVGPYGLLQAFADLLKMIQKEDLAPSSADRRVFLAAPILIFALVFTAFALLPAGPQHVPADAATGLLLMVAVVGLDVVGLLLSGYASNSKFSLLGSLRAISQMFSYEVPLGLCLLAVAVFSQSLNLYEIGLQQSTGYGNWLFSLPFLKADVTLVGGFLSWNLVRMPLFAVLFVIFYICILAESNRAPFDLAEGESELVGGFHTEYSGFRWALFFLSEYAMMVLLCGLASILFLGGWNTPLPNIGPLRLADWTGADVWHWSGPIWAVFWLMLKTTGLCVSQIWVRWTFPRLRADQLMHLCWKVLTPFALAIVVLAAAWRLWLIG